MNEFKLPDLGEGLTEAEIVAWHVAVGDEVTVDQVVVEVETAKASVEVPIPYAGTVSALHGKVGDTVAVGAALISVGTAAESSEYSGNVLIGYGTSAASNGRRLRRPTPVLADEPDIPGPAAKSGRVAVVSPLVRKLARDAELDLASIKGTGPSGLIMRRDVESALQTPQAPAAEPDVQRIPIQGVRKAMAEKLATSRREIPEATVWVDVDATDLLTARAAINARRPEEPVSLLALLARFVIAGLARYPELNGRIENGELVLPTAVNLGFAAQTTRGLIVPVVHGAQKLSMR